MTGRVSWLHGRYHSTTKPITQSLTFNIAVVVQAAKVSRCDSGGPMFKSQSLGYNHVNELFLVVLGG